MAVQAVVVMANSPLIAVSQRYVPKARYDEDHDTLDQRWAAFLEACGCIMFPVPNHLATAQGLMERCCPDGVLLTGGGAVKACGGAERPRDEVESFLMYYAADNGLPLMAVCRGMQQLQATEGVRLEKISSHVGDEHAVRRHKVRFEDSSEREVNSYHGWGAYVSVDSLPVLARAEDGVIEAVRHVERSWYGIMWHPEREVSFVAEDIAWFKRIYGC